MKPTQATLTLLAAAALLATQPGAGCVTDGTSGSPDPSPGPGPVPSQGPVYAPAGNTSSPENTDRVPNQADIVKEGKGVLEYTADADGTIWVQDVHEESTIVSHRIHRGEKVRVAPEEDRVYIDGSSISKNDIRRDNSHRIYLEKDRRFEDRDDRDRDRWRDSDRNNDRDYGTNGGTNGGNNGGSGGNAPRGDLSKVPNGSEMIGEGKAKAVSAWISRDGQVYVYDADQKKVAAVVRVRAGDRFVFSPDDDRVTVNGTIVVGRDFSTKTNYRVYEDR